MEKRILNRKRIRKITDGFAFIPHRFLKDGFLNSLEPAPLLLYLFLVVASDGYGLSFYSDKSVCRLLKMQPTELDDCRNVLISSDLLAYQTPLYQVLELPRFPIHKKDVSTNKSDSQVLDLPDISINRRDIPVLKRDKTTSIHSFGQLLKSLNLRDLQ